MSKEKKPVQDAFEVVKLTIKGKGNPRRISATMILPTFSGFGKDSLTIRQYIAQVNHFVEIEGWSDHETANNVCQQSLKGAAKDLAPSLAPLAPPNKLSWRTLQKQLISQFDGTEKQKLTIREKIFLRKGLKQGE